MCHVTHVQDSFTEVRVGFSEVHEFYGRDISCTPSIYLLPSTSQLRSFGEPLSLPADCERKRPLVCLLHAHFRATAQAALVSALPCGREFGIDQELEMALFVCGATQEFRLNLYITTANWCSQMGIHGIWNPPFSKGASVGATKDCVSLWYLGIRVSAVERGPGF